MKITFLGTSCMLPTKTRSHPAFILEYGSEGLLFDCGEGTQRQFAICGVKITKVSKIFITHFHGDHMLGLPGLLQSLGQGKENAAVEVYGPKNTKMFLDNMQKSMYWDKRIRLTVHEIMKDSILEFSAYSIEARYLKHGVPCLGYAFVEKNRRRIDLKKAAELGLKEGPQLGKLQQGETITWKSKTIKPEEVTYEVQGKKIVYLTDTAMCDNCLKLAEDADVLICEATYATKLQKKAEEFLHLTAQDAGLIASRANVGRLILTHCSARYKSTAEVEEDAQKVFDKAICAEDFMKITL